MSDSAKKPAPRPATRERSKSEVGSPPIRRSTPTTTKEKIKAVLGEKTTPVSSSKRPASVNLTPTRTGSAKKPQEAPTTPNKFNNINNMTIEESDELKEDLQVPSSPRSQIMQLFGAGLQSVQQDLENKLASKQEECQKLMFEKQRLENEFKLFKSRENDEQSLANIKEIQRLKEQSSHMTFELENMREYTKRQEDIITAIMREKNQVREQAQKEIDEIKRRNERQEELILNLNKEKEELKANQEIFRVNLDREIKEQAQKEIDALKNDINNEKKAQSELKEQLEQLTEEHRKVLDENLKDPESMMELEALKEENDKLRESEGYITSLLDKIEKLNHERTTWIGQSKELEKIKFEHKLLFQRYEELKHNKERELSNKFHEDLAKISDEKSKIEKEFQLLSQRYEELLTARLDSSRSSGLSQSFDEPDISFIFKIQEERDRALAANEDLQKTIEELNNINTNVQQRGNALQKELSETKSHLDKLISMTEQERSLEISELQKIIENKDKQIIDLNKNVIVLEQSHVELIKEKEQIRNEVSAIQNSLVEKDSEISRLHDQHDVLVQRNVILTNEVEHHEREKILIEKRAAQIELAARKAQTNIEEIARKRDKQLQDEISRINEMNSRLQKRIEEISQNCEDLMQLNEEQDKEIDELQNELANQRAAASRLSVEKEALREDFESKLSLIADKYTEERQRIENELKNLVESREEMENELKTELTVKESQWQAKEEELNNKVKDLKETIQRLRGNKQDSKIILKTEENKLVAVDPPKTPEELQNMHKEIVKLSKMNSSSVFWLRVLTITTGVLIASNVARFGIKHFRYVK